MKVKPPPGSVVVAHELSPADVAQFHRAGVAALAMDVGGRTSHTALMARAFELPAVVGLKDVSERVENGDLVVVDGLAGDVILHAGPELVAQYQERATVFQANEQELLQDLEKPAVTEDGFVVRLLANVELAEEVPLALDHGAEGIGLYRTEFLYMGREALPSVEDHQRDARLILEGMGDRPVTFRTFDLGGGEKSAAGIKLPREDNPALGLRSIRLAFHNEEIFRCQLEGLLRASPAGRMKIMFPMVSGVQELRKARAMLEDCREDLARKSIPVAEELEVGIMVEMPAAAMIADMLARECDFFAIGSNDLIQYSLAIDRGNELVNYLYHPLHPAILRLIRFVVRVAHAEGIRVSLCGEMAGDPSYTMVLLGLGLDELSMPPGAVPRIKRIVRASSVAESLALAEELVRMPTVEAIENRVKEVMCSRFTDELGTLSANLHADLSCPDPFRGEPNHAAGGPTGVMTRGRTGGLTGGDPPQRPGGGRGAPGARVGLDSSPGGIHTDDEET